METTFQKAMAILFAVFLLDLMQEPEWTVHGSPCTSS